MSSISSQNVLICQFDINQLLAKQLIECVTEQTDSLLTVSQFEIDTKCVVKIICQLKSISSDDSAAKNTIDNFLRSNHVDYIFKNLADQHSLGIYLSARHFGLIDQLLTNEMLLSERLLLDFLISDSDEVEQLANRHGIPFYRLHTGEDPIAFERELFGIVQRFKPDFLGIMGLPQVLSAHIIRQMQCQIYQSNYAYISPNSKPVLHREAFQNSLPLVAASASLVTYDFHRQPVIHQDTVALSYDATLSQRKLVVYDLEHRVFIQGLQKLLCYDVVLLDNSIIRFR